MSGARCERCERGPVADDIFELVKRAWETPTNFEAVAHAARAAGLEVNDPKRALYVEGRWPEYPEEWRPTWEQR